jgi:hypothetical protein
MALADKQATDRSTDDYLGFGAPVKTADEHIEREARPEVDEESYVDSWYQVLKAQAAEEA